MHSIISKIAFAVFVILSGLIITGCKKMHEHDVVYTDLSNAPIYSSSANYTSIDIDKDGEAEFQFFKSVYSQGGTPTSPWGGYTETHYQISVQNSKNGISSQSSANGNDAIGAKTTFGSEIFYTSHSGYSSGLKYYPIRFVKNKKDHYGWMLVDWNDGKIIAFAYAKHPNRIIEAGQK
ncbi:MAG: hypothetical protein IAF38_13620 [Bacteroidia bacterium]|nr:hypothetical protein [Bacteroidia bacterium]